MFVCICLFVIASHKVGLPGPSDFVDRSLTLTMNGGLHVMVINMTDSGSASA